MNTIPIQSWLGWQQPIPISSNTTYGTISASSYAENCDPYKAVDGVTSTESQGWATNNLAEGWWMWELPTTLRFKRLVFVNRNSSTNDPEVLNQQCQFYIGNKQTAIGVPFSVSKSREYVTIECNEEESNILYFYKLGGKYSGIGELIIEADEYKTTGQSVYMSDVKKVYTNNKSVVQVYNAGTLIWEDPELNPYRTLEVPEFTDNFSYGCLNASSSGSNAYKVFDTAAYSTDAEQGYNSYISSAAAPQWLMWKLPNEILVKHITFKNNYSTDGERTKTAQFFADENMTVPLTPEFTAVNEDGGVSEFNVDTIKTDTIYCYLKEGYGTNGIVGVGEINVQGRARLNDMVSEEEDWSVLQLPVLDSNDVEETEDTIGISLATNNPEPIPVVKEFPWEQPSRSNWTTTNTETWDTSHYYTVSCDGSHTDNQRGIDCLGDEGSGWHSRTSSLPHWVGFYTPPIKVQSFSFRVDATDSYIPTLFEWQGSNDGSHWTVLDSFTRDSNNTSTESYSISEENQDFYSFNRLYIKEANSRYQYICNLQITAVVFKEDSFDYGSIYKLFDKDTSEIAWTSTEVSSWDDTSVEVDVPWVQPVFTNNNTWGVVTVSEVESSSYGWKALDGNPDSVWSSGVSAGDWFDWRFLKPLKITNVRIWQRTNAGNYPTGTVSIYEDDSKENLLGSADLGSSISSGAYVDVSITYSSYIDGIYIEISGHGIGEILLTAFEKGIITAYPPYIQMSFSDSVAPRGITIVNGNSAITSFEWQASKDGESYQSLGTFSTPEFFHAANSECSVPIPLSENDYKYHRFIVRGLTDNANIVSVKELIPSFMKKKFPASSI